ncbi:hypothetical protein KUF83_29885 [Streptomyces sp. BV286]|uniref:hypothetical protein n=1 Tax=Streptomyces sp. BV286 TaxID=2849672 RepID=UPI001C2E0F22|nr:hypothetical protein [Streptomyces sp. BV286]MBV1940746.1 hypothetical protein [Streptomyces sp. BV286]
MTEHGFPIPPHAPPEVIAERNKVADAVVRELLRTGLPAYRGDDDEGPRGEIGAEVHVEPFDTGAVYVDWNITEELRDSALSLFEKGIDPSDPPPEFRHYGAVHQHMRDALLGILESAGFEAEPADGHTHGGAIRVNAFRY